MKTKDTILNLLEDIPKLRDSDNKLICNYWWLELKSKKIDPDNLSCKEFLSMYAESKLTNAETIRRTRAQIQEDKKYQHLRGEKYLLRQTKIQDSWREKLGYTPKTYE